MFEKVTMRRTPQFADFSLLSNLERTAKEPNFMQRMRSKEKNWD